ncbi:MAG TPA: hypothetical protein HA257_09005 [Candidatus Methanoperedenaceae archaeon]|nr:hypothetical protein [Candidatus Methanoperedenaceae archaeon]
MSVKAGMIIVYSLEGLHELNSGIILASFAFAFYRSYRAGREPFLAAFALLIFALSILPTPLHGTGVWGIVSLAVTYLYLLRIWGKDTETTMLVLVALGFMMLNIAVGLRLSGRL